jgi:hypothetical protein
MFWTETDNGTRERDGALATHRKVIVHLKRLVADNHRFVVPNADHYVMVAGLSRLLREIIAIPRGLAVLAGIPQKPKDQVSEVPSVAHFVELLLNLIQPQFVRITTTALEILNLLLGKEPNIDMILVVLSEWEKRRQLGDFVQLFVQLLLAIGSQRSDHRYDMAVLEFFGRLFRALDKRPEMQISVCQRLTATGIRTKFQAVGQQDLRMEEWVSMISTEPTQADQVMNIQYGTTTAEPIRQANIYFALLTNEEQKARMATGPMRIEVFKRRKEVQDASVIAIYRMFLELVWMCGH